MRIEILTRSVEKKPEIITYLRSLRGFGASSGKAAAEGVEAELAREYILLTVTVPWLADELVRMLLTVRPVPFAPSFYEIAGDPKAIVTCAARPLNRVIPALDVLEHLDLEAGELAGRFETRWSSRDVDVFAAFEVAVQGGVAVARVKFGSHFRESEHHCREALSRADLTGGISVFSVEDGLVKPAAVSPVALTAAISAGNEACAVFLNRCPGSITYLEAPGEYIVHLPGDGNRLVIAGKNKNLCGVRISLETPWRLGGSLIETMGELFGIGRVEAARTITGLTLNPDDLLHRLGFAKGSDFLIFGAELDGLEALYDIGRRNMKIWAPVSWHEAGNLKGAFDRIGEFTGRVMQFAI